MTKHNEMRAEPAFYIRLIHGLDHFEVMTTPWRAGDTLIVREWVPEQQDYTGRKYAVDVMEVHPSPGNRQWIYVTPQVPASVHMSVRNRDDDA